MNKKDKEQLASIVSEMLYAYSSERQTIAYGERILENFPCLKENLDQYKEVEEIYNLISVFKSALLGRCLTHSRVTKEDNFIFSISVPSDTMYEIFDHYLYTTNTTAEEILEELDNLKKQGSDITKTILRIIQSPDWLEALEGETEGMTPELEKLLKGEYILKSTYDIKVNLEGELYA